jgi:hypothetical protein
VSQEQANLNSLAMVREELDTTIQRAAGEFEVFMADTHNLASIENCRNDVAQVAGTLRLIQCVGAAALADEMAATVGDVAAAAPAASEALAGALSHAFFALPRYIEFMMTRKFLNPYLVLSYINELRVARRQPMLPEYHFDPVPLSLTPVTPLTGSDAPANPATLARLRQMYQVGLLGILRQKNEALNLQLIARAAARFAAQTPVSSGRGLWQLAAAVAESLANGSLTINLNRKRTLGAIERLMARYVKGGEEALVAMLDNNLRKELVYQLALSVQREGLVKSVVAAFRIPALTPNDKELTAYRDAMRGPGLEAIDSVVKVLKEELRNAKDILEIASQNQGISADEVTPLRETLNRVADTLQMINLRAPADILRGQLQMVEGWAGQQNGVPADQFLSVADALLFIESSLSSLYRHELTAGDLAQVSDVMRKQIIAESHFAEASKIVIDEAQNGIAMAKRAITSYAESNFDPVHIANVAVTLSSVRGGVQLLGYVRAANILKGCVAFVDLTAHEKQANGSQRQQLLETLADALISMEYYLTELAANRSPDDRILEVAEESLEALGFLVDKQ